MRAAVVIAMVMLFPGQSLAFPGQHIQPCDKLPPLSARQPITVDVAISDVQSSLMSAWCHKQPGTVMYGCTFPPTAEHRQALILLNADLSPAERVCTLIYEKSHLPPNNWQDPVAEARATDLPSVKH